MYIFFFFKDKFKFIKKFKKYHITFNFLVYNYIDISISFKMCG